MSPPHKLPPVPDDEEVVLVVESGTVHEDIAAGVELPPVKKPEREMNEWERAGVRPPQAYR